MSNAIKSACVKIIQQTHIQTGALHMEEGQFKESYQDSNVKLKDLRTEYAAEVSALDVAAKRLITEVGPSIVALPARLEEVVKATVASFQVTPKDIEKDKIERTSELIGKAINDAVRHTSRVESEKTQYQIEQCLEKEIERLGSFAESLSQTLNEIEVHFQNVSNKKERTAGDYVAEGAAAAPVIFVSYLLGGVWGGYQEAGLKGAAVGGVAGIATGFGAAVGAGLVISALSLPLTWPVTLPAMVLVGVSSFLGGKFASRMAFRGADVRKFKEAVQQHALEQLRANFHESKIDLNKRIQSHVKEAFSALRHQLDQELGGAIEQTQRTLDELSANIHRSSAIREHELERLLCVEEEVKVVLARTERLSTYINQLSH